ncbi:hypothetical protein D3C87_1597590 [compost metagenome]
MRVDGVVQRVAEQRAEIMGEAIGKNALALDQAGIAVGRLFACAATVEQHHRLAAPRQMDGGRYADDAGAENHYVSLHVQMPRYPIKTASSDARRVGPSYFFFSPFMICSR